MTSYIQSTSTNKQTRNKNKKKHIYVAKSSLPSLIHNLTIHNLMSIGVIIVISIQLKLWNQVIEPIILWILQIFHACVFRYPSHFCSLIYHRSPISMFCNIVTASMYTHNDAISIKVFKHLGSDTKLCSTCNIGPPLCPCHVSI